MIITKHSCIIPDYPTEIKVSEKKRAVYWKSGQLLPKKYRDTTKFDFKDGVLVELATGEKVIRNAKTAGLPRMLSINAQKIYVGIHHSVRSKIVNELHELFNREFKKQLPAKININGRKILIALHFYDVYTPKLPDLDNLANLFVKCGLDCLTTANNPNQTKGGATHKLGILPDDKMQFIPHIVVEFSPITDITKRRLEFNLYEVSPAFTVESILNFHTCSPTGTTTQP